MKLKREIHCLLLAVIIAWPMCTTAAEKERTGGEGPPDGRAVAVDAGRITCYESADYLVVAKETPGKVGTDFLVKYKSNPGEKPACTYAPGNGHFEIRNEWAEYFAGLKDDLLVPDSTTGPGPSGLVIWDLRKRKKVYVGSWSDSEGFRDHSLVYWTETGEATPDNCPELECWKSKGLEGAIETKVILNLCNFQMSETPETRCSPRQ